MNELPGPDTGLPAPPFCPRHPDRESWVRCQRCGRPVCAQCQRPAAVGVHCVDCVAEAAHGSRTPRTRFGGQLRGRDALVTKVIVGLCLAVWVGELVRPALVVDFGFAPVVGWSEPWRAITGAFLHDRSSPMHVGFNMFSLWVFGTALEPSLGRVRFALLYLVSAVGGAAAIVLLAAAPAAGTLGRTVQQTNPSWVTLTVGASAAIFGLFGAYMVINRGLGRSNSGMWTLLVANAVFGFLVPNVSWQGHLGGLLTGAACGGVLMATRVPGRRRWAVPGLLAVLAVVVALAAVKYAGVSPLYR